MTTGEMSTVVSSNVRRNTIVNLKQVNELPLRNALESFDKNGDGKIDLHELQKIIYWYGLWKYASIGLCLVIMLLVWSTFGLTIWAINLTKDYTVTGGVMTGAEEVVKMSVANTYIPLSWASLLDRRHLDALDSLTIEVAQGNGNFAAGVYHVKVASYVHANSTYIKLFGEDGSRVWVQSGTVVLHHPDANEAVMVCGAAACNTLAVDVKPEYLQQLVQRSAALFQSNRDFELPSSVDGVAISKAAGEDVTCMASPIGVDADEMDKAQHLLTDMQNRWTYNRREPQRSAGQDGGHLKGGSSGHEANRQVFFGYVDRESINAFQEGATIGRHDGGISSKQNKPEFSEQVPDESQIEAKQPSFGAGFPRGSPAASVPGDIPVRNAAQGIFGPGGLTMDITAASSNCNGLHCTIVSSGKGTSVSSTTDIRGFIGAQNVPKPAQFASTKARQLPKATPKFGNYEGSTAFGLFPAEGEGDEEDAERRRLMMKSKVGGITSVSVGDGTAHKGYAGAMGQKAAQLASLLKSHLPQYTPDFGSSSFGGIQRRRLKEDDSLSFTGMFNNMNNVDIGSLVSFGDRASDDLSAQHVPAEDGQLSQATPDFSDEDGSNGFRLDGAHAAPDDSRRRLSSFSQNKGFTYMNTVSKSNLVNHGDRILGELAAQYVPSDTRQLHETPEFGAADDGSKGAWGLNADTDYSRRRLQSIHKRIAKDGTTVDITNINSFGEATQDDGTATYFVAPSGRGMKEISSMSAWEGDAKFRINSAARNYLQKFGSATAQTKKITEQIERTSTKLDKAIQQLDKLHERVWALDEELIDPVFVREQFDMSFVVKFPSLAAVRVSETKPNFSSEMKQGTEDAHGIQINLDASRASVAREDRNQPVAPKKGPLNNKPLDHLMPFDQQEDAGRNNRPKDISFILPEANEPLLMKSELQDMSAAHAIIDGARASASKSGYLGALKWKPVNSVEQEKGTGNMNELLAALAGSNAVLDAAAGDTSNAN